MLNPSLLLALLSLPLLGASSKAYCRMPAIHGGTVVFTAEGDLWRVPLSGGIAQRLTSHPGEEGRAALSPDGRTLAFNAAYEGVNEVYTMPLEGGLPTRLTYQGGYASVVGWTPEGKLLISTRIQSTLPSAQLAVLDPATRAERILPLAQAADGAFEGQTLFFTRLPFQGSYTKRYKGGTVQNLWRFTPGEAEARPLTADFNGTSKAPMLWKGRVYFLSDRDGTMNLWSMNPEGKELRQHTRHKGWDIQSASLSDGHVAYQLGADLRVLELESGKDRALEIRLASDYDHQREKWVKNPLDYLSASHVSPSGDRVVLTARGQVFVAPVGAGRLVEATRAPGVRYRDGRFMPDGKTILAHSDASGEVEFWLLPSNGTGQPRQLTKGGKVLRWEGLPSPDGKRIAHWDKASVLWLVEVATGQASRIATNPTGDTWGTGWSPDSSLMAWSPDSRFLAFTNAAMNRFGQLHLYSLETKEDKTLTSDRFNSSDPAWSPDGKWLYFASERNLRSSVATPWGLRNPEPHFENQTKLYHVPLQKGLRSPFQPKDELAPAEASGKGADAKAAEVKVTVDFEGLEHRVQEVPVAPGDYGTLALDGKRIYFMAREGRRRALRSIALSADGAKDEAVMDDIQDYELSADGKKLLVRKGTDHFIFEAGAKAPSDLAKVTVNLKEWSFALNPKEEWRQMFIEAWRLERDYFYDKQMHGVDWPAMRDKYLPLVDRVTDRAELSDLIAQMVGELSTLHTFVRGGDLRVGADKVEPASLVAEWVKVPEGFRIEGLPAHDPDLVDEVPPLSRPEVALKKGDILEAINGQSLKDAADPSELLRGQAGRQVLLRVKGSAGSRDVIAVPVAQARAEHLRYNAWELERRQRVEQKGGGKLGYVHLRAMEASDIAQFYRDYYPVAGREGLIIDVRHNRGGNIDAWLLEKLMRKAWFWWQPRTGVPYVSMHDAFRGPMVVLCNERTASDGEAFAEGFRRLGLGKVIGTRTWGGEVWLSSSNFLMDRGIATAAETGVFGPEGQWLIEGHGVDPDLIVDNPPHATFKGEDAQLDAAIRHLQEDLARKPVPAPKAPPYPDKSFQGGPPGRAH